MDRTQTESLNQDSLLCCRACLSTDGRLYNIHEYKLADAFARVSGSAVFWDGPQHLCSYCSAQLLRCESFRTKCQRSQLCLRQQGELDNEFIRTIDRASHKLLLNLTTTPVQNVNCVDPDLKTDTEIKNESTIDIFDTDSSDNIIKKVNLIPDGDIKYEVNTEKVEEVFVVSDVPDIKRRKRKATTAKKKIKREVEVDDADNGFDDGIADFRDDDDDDICLVDLAAKYPVKKEKESNVKKRKNVAVEMVKEKEAKVDPKEKKQKKGVKVKKKKELKKKFRNAANDFLPDFPYAEFEATYLVHCVILSKQDQLDEIATRKETPNYMESAFQCEDCGKGFISEESYNNHRLRHDPNAGAFPCPICAVRFDKRSKMQTHQDMHRLKFFCKQCSFVSRTRHQAKQHHEMHVGKTFECQHCGKTFNKSSTYLSHVRLAHPAMNLACDVCGETFVGHLGLRMHKRKMHPETLNPEAFKCNDCLTNFQSSEALNKHVATAGAHRDLRPCEQCGENCASEDALLKHRAEKHPKESYRCDECNATFTSAASYDLHHRRKHLNEPFSAAGRRIANYPPRVQGQFVCEQCGRIMPSRVSLRHHKREHKGLKPHVCRECPKAFSTKRALDWHIRSHTGERPYQCPECPLAFSVKSNLKRHHKAVHLGLRNSVPCPICGRVFTTSSCVRVHVNTVHHGQPGPKRTNKRKRKPVPESPATLMQ